MGGGIISLGPWLGSPAGACVAQWEQQACDRLVADVFGLHALQLGLPELPLLRSNRIPHRWVLQPDAAWPRPSPSPSFAPPQAPLAPLSSTGAEFAPALVGRPEALPFPANSLDLLVLPHTLEWSDDPHLALREAERVLRPQGRLLITGFHPMSLWAWRQMAGRWRRRHLLAAKLPLFMPEKGEFLAPRRLRDWLALLGLQVESAQSGCRRPPFRHAAWLERWAWMESGALASWPWPGAVYLMMAVKQVRGVRLLGLSRHARRHRALRKPAPASVIGQADLR